MIAVVGSRCSARILAGVVALTGGAACGRIGYDAIDAAPPDESVYASCTEVRDTRPEAGDGYYLIDAVGSPPVRAYCDLTTDGGGWMLVTRDMIADEKSLSVTIVKTEDARGGLIVRVFANNMGCTDPVDNVYLVTFTERPAWTQIRARHTFAGGASCWWIFGGVNLDPSAEIAGQVIVPNLRVFEPGVDVIRDQVRMGGAAGAAFDGLSERCDNEPENFWHEDRGPEERSAEVIQRRNLVPGSAGLATTASCVEFGPGTTSPTWWQYSDTSVR